MGRLSRVVMLVVVAVAVAGCGRESSAPKPAAPQVHRLEGSYTVHGVFRHRNYGAPCKAADAGYADIHSGTPVVVREKSGAVVGSATLGDGTLRQQPLRGRDDDCQFRYSLTVPDRDVYRIQVSERGYVEFSRADLERSGWKAELTIGAYTMFGGD